MKHSLWLPAGRAVPCRPAWDAPHRHQLFPLEQPQEQPSHSPFPSPTPGGSGTRVAGRDLSRDSGTQLAPG